MGIMYLANYVGYSGGSIKNAKSFFKNFAKANNMTVEELRKEIEEAEQMAEMYNIMTEYE